MKNITYGEKPSPLYTWAIIVASALVMFGFWGASGSFGVFLKPIEDELGLTRAMVSGAMSTVSGVSGLIGIIAGRLTDKYGARMLIIIGALVGGSGYLFMYRAHALWELYLYFGVFIGICAGLCWTPVLANVSRRFNEGKRRVMAVGITTGGITIGQMVIPPFTAYLIIKNDWRLAYVILAIIVLIAAIPAVILLSKRPPQNKYENERMSVDFENEKSMYLSSWSARQAAKTLPFWMLMVTGFVTATGFYFMLVHIVAYAIDIEISSTLAALVLTCMNAGSYIAQLMVWTLTSRIGTRYSVVICIGLQALALFLLIGAQSYWMLLVLGTVFGLGFGGGTTIRMSMVSEFFGTSSVGLILGLVTTSWAIGGIIGPILAGYIFDISHSYDIAFLVGGLLLVVGVISGFFLKAPADTAVRGVRL